MSRRVAFTSPTRAPPSMEVAVKERGGGGKWGKIEDRHGKPRKGEGWKKERKREKEDRGRDGRVSVTIGKWRDFLLVNAKFLKEARRRLRRMSRHRLSISGTWPARTSTAPLQMRAAASFASTNTFSPCILSLLQIDCHCVEGARCMPVSRR